MNLEFNTEYTYDEMCELMNEPPQHGGKQRNNQLAKWRQFYDIDKVGKNYVLLRKYTKDELKLTENHGKFTTYISNLMVQYLATQEQSEVCMTYREILEMLWMVNKDYFPTKYGQKNVELTYNLNPIDGNQQVLANNVSMFFSISGRILKQIVNDSLASMEKRSLLIANKSFRLFRREQNADTKEIITVSHECTPQEVSEILDFQSQAMKIVGIKSLSQLMYLSQQKRQTYFNYVNDRVYERFGYDRYAKSWRLILGQKALQAEYYEVLSKDKLNANVQDKLLTSKEMKLLSTTINEQMVENYIKV